jgi:poly(3-hydroxybutyrate) depolymerase
MVMAITLSPAFAGITLHNPPKGPWKGRETLTWIDGNNEARAVDIYVPKNVSGTYQLPIVMWFMGSRAHIRNNYHYLGMCYHDCGIAPVAEENKFMLIVIDERHVGDKTWEIVDKDTIDQTLVFDVLAYVEKTFSIDKTRIYLWGLSAGGKIAQYLAAKHSEVFAAVCSASGVVDDFNDHYFDDMIKYIKTSPRKFPIAHYQTAGDYESLITNMKVLLKLYRDSGYPVEFVWFENNIPGRNLRHEWYADLYNLQMWNWCNQFQVIGGKTVTTPITSK